MAVAEVWESSLQGVKSYGAYGPRDVLILTSSEGLQGENIVPRKEGCLTKEDRDRLSSQGIPEDCWDSDARLMEARYKREGERFEVQVLGYDEVLTSERVKEEIRSLMNNTIKPGDGSRCYIFNIAVVLHYIGPGKKNTGDWCFSDGFIDFRDIMDAYMECFREEAKCLEVTSDCSYSGKWVIALREFLNEVGVQPCGHSARKEGFLLKVRTSCRSHEIPHTLLYSARGRGNDKNTGTLYVQGNNYEIEQGQHNRTIDNTCVTCKKDASFEDPCSLSEVYTWHNESEAERVFLVRGKDKGRPAWHYILVVDDEEIIELFHKKVKSGNIDVADFGQVIKSGWGQDPPDDVREWIQKKYRADT